MVVIAVTQCAECEGFQTTQGASNFRTRQRTGSSSLSSTQRPLMTAGEAEGQQQITTQTQEQDQQPFFIRQAVLAGEYTIQPT
jgi:hypothetical protein